MQPQRDANSRSFPALLLSQTLEEIERYSVDESLSDLDRVVTLLRRGQPAQRLSCLQALGHVFFSATAPAALAPALPRTERLALGAAGPAAEPNYNAALDKVLPAISAMLSPADTPLEERCACLDALAAICRSVRIPGAVLSTRIVPLILRALGKDNPEQLQLAASSSISAALQHGACNTPAAVADVVTTALSLGGVANTATQRVLCCRLLALLVSERCITIKDAQATFLDKLLALCQDVEAAVRCEMARLLLSLLHTASSLIRSLGASAYTGGGSPALGTGLPHLVLRDRCLEELLELLGDEDPSVRAAAADTSIQALDAGTNALPADFRRNLLLPALHRMWEGKDHHVSATSSTERDDPVRSAFSQRIGMLLLACARNGDFDAAGKYAVDVPRRDELASPSVAPTVGGLVADADTAGAKGLRGRRSSLGPGSPTAPVSAVPVNVAPTAAASPAAGPATPSAGTVQPQFLSARQRRMSRRFSSAGADAQAMASAVAASTAAQAGTTDAAMSAALARPAPQLLLQSLVDICTGMASSQASEARLHAAKNFAAASLAVIAVVRPASPLMTAPPASATSTAGKSASKVVGVGGKIGTASAVVAAAKRMTALGGGSGNNAGAGAGTETDASDEDVDLLLASAAALRASSSAGAVAALAFRTNLLPAAARLATDTSTSVKVALASGLHHVAAAVGHSRAARLFGPIYYTMLQDSSEEVCGCLVDTAHMWVAALCPHEPALRIATFSALMPLLLGAWNRPAVSRSWRRQLSYFAMLRLLPFVFPAPQATEAALTICVNAIATLSKPVRSAAVHTLVWFMRHSPSGRVRLAVRDFISSRFASMRSVREHAATVLSSIHAAQESGLSASTGKDVGTTTDVEKGSARGLQSTPSVNSGLAAPLASGSTAAQSTASAAMSQLPIPVGAGLTLPLQVVIGPLTNSVLPLAALQHALSPSPFASALIPFHTSLSGPGWRRQCAIDALAAALWVYSRQHVKSFFLPPVMDCALSDPVPSVRCAALEALAALRPWLKLPGDAEAVTSIIVCLQTAMSDSNTKVSRAGASALARLRLIDSAVTQVMPAGTPWLSELLTPAPSVSALKSMVPASRPQDPVPALSLSGGSAGASDAAPTMDVGLGSITGRRRSAGVPLGIGLRIGPTDASTSAAPAATASAAPTARKAPTDSSTAGTARPAAETRAVMPPEAVDIACSAAALASAAAAADFKLLSVQDPDNPRLQALPADSVRQRVDGPDAVASISAFSRNPFRLCLTSALPSLPASCVLNVCQQTTTAVASLYPDGTSAPKGSSSQQLSVVFMDDMVGCQTAVHTLEAVTKSVDGGRPPAAVISSMVGASAQYTYAQADVSKPVDSSTAQQSCLQLGWLWWGALARSADGDYPSLLAAVADVDLVQSQVRSYCQAYSCQAKQISFVSAQLLCAAPHSDGEESTRQAAESVLAVAARNEDDAEKRRPAEERRGDFRKEKEKAVAAAAAAAAADRDKPGTCPDTGLPFTATAWPAQLANAATLVATNAAAVSASLYPACAEGLLPPPSGHPNTSAFVIGATLIGASASPTGIYFTTPATNTPSTASATANAASAGMLTARSKQTVAGAVVAPFTVALGALPLTPVLLSSLLVALQHQLQPLAATLPPQASLASVPSFSGMRSLTPTAATTFNNQISPVTVKSLGTSDSLASFTAQLAHAAASSSQAVGPLSAVSALGSPHAGSPGSRSTVRMTGARVVAMSSPESPGASGVAANSAASSPAGLLPRRTITSLAGSMVSAASSSLPTASTPVLNSGALAAAAALAVAPLTTGPSKPSAAPVVAARAQLPKAK